MAKKLLNPSWQRVRKKNKETSNKRLKTFTAVPLPQFDGVAPSPVLSNNTPSLANTTSHDIITEDERKKYINIFTVHRPHNGVLDAKSAKGLFLKSKLPVDTLSHIW